MEKLAIPLMQEDIDGLTSKTILEEDLFCRLFDLDEISRATCTVMLRKRAKELGCLKDFTTIFKACESEEKKDNEELKKHQAKRECIFLKFNDKGIPLQSIENFSSILNNDSTLKDKFAYNELSECPEQIINGKKTRWLDEDDSRLRQYIETTYGLFNEKKLDDAVRIKFAENKYHPIKQLIEAVEWDQQPRIENLLIKWLGVENTSYSKEVSRLIFAGGINRLYNPGCKFDDMPVLIGTKQGEGKSTFVRWLALKDDFFCEITDIDGQKGMENIQGSWICEMGELLALKRTKDVEAVKAFISRLIDKYRNPYDKRVSEHKRQCVFIGTTNNTEFLTDKTGNRRYYPVTTNSTGYELFEHQEQIKADIIQCWAEALVLFKCGEMKPFANRDLIGIIKAKQNEAVEEDYRIGMIEEYLEDKTEVCGKELWHEALKEERNPTRRDSNDIVVIMQSFSEWVRGEKATRCGNYGIQKVWKKENSDPILPF